MCALNIKLNDCRGDFSLSCDLCLPCDQIIALYGPSGSGKTTLLRMLSGLDKCSESSINIKNTVWQDSHTFVPVHRRKVGFIFQDDELFPHLNVAKNILYGHIRSQRSQSSQSLEEIYRSCHVQQLLHKMPNQLSGGELQRVLLAQVLANEPDLILFDEAFNALDTHNKKLILHTLKNHQKTHSIPVIYVSHQFKELAELADYLVLIEDGKIVNHGKFSQLTSDPHVVAQHIPEPYLNLTAKIIAFSSCRKDMIVEIDDQRLTLVTPTKLLNDPKSSDYLGKPMDLCMNTKDISLSIQPITQSSIPHTLFATVVEVTDYFVKLKLKNQHLLCPTCPRVTEKLKLQLGQKVYAHVNAMTSLFY